MLCSSLPQQKYLEFDSKWSKNHLTKRIGVLYDFYEDKNDNDDKVSILKRPTIDLLREKGSVQQTGRLWSKVGRKLMRFQYVISLK